MWFDCCRNIEDCKRMDSKKKAHIFTAYLVVKNTFNNIIKRKKEFSIISTSFQFSLETLQSIKEQVNI